MVFKLNNQLLSKIANGDGHGEESPYFDGWKAYDSDPYHLTKNPTGVIQMGLAENQLCFDLVQEWVKKNSHASICTPEGANEFLDVAIFQDYNGLPEFRNAVAKFMARVRGDRVTFDPKRIVMSGGATGAHETLAFCLADPGDAFLVPTPYYPGFDRDLRWRTGVQLIPVVCDQYNNFKVTIEALESAYEMAQLKHITVKGLLITNPSNPLGNILDRDTLTDIVRFINKKNIHLICDEIYAATVFRQPEFVSISEIIDQEEEECNLELIHLVYSLSKDMGFPGFRVGIIYSYNDTVMNCARKMSSFGLVSSQTQHLLASMLSDDEFIDRFISESKERLATRHRIFTKELDLLGIKCLETSNAGLFLWMDLHGLLKEQTPEGEMELWRVIIKEVKLNVSPGTSFHCKNPGWFRACIANMDDQTMEVAVARIREFVNKKSEKNKPAAAAAAAKKLLWQKSLKLSFSSRTTPRIYDDFIKSPHSPMMPQSPLVRAKN